MRKFFRGNNLRIAIAVGVVLLVIIFAWLFAVSGASEKKSQQSQPTQSQDNQGKNTVDFPASNATNPTHAALTGAPQTKVLPYEVGYPEGWKVTTVAFPGGYSVMMRPPAFWIGDPIIVIEAYEQPTEVAPKEKLFEADGFAKTTIMVDNTKATKFSGTWHTRAVDGVVMQVVNQERIVFIPQPDGRLYSIKMYYSQEEPNPVYDKLFEQILASFKVKK